MSQRGHLMDEADIGSGEQENAERDAIQEEIRKIPEDNRPGKRTEDVSPHRSGPPQSSAEDCVAPQA